jgi:hypothetical protein
VDGAPAPVGFTGFSSSQAVAAEEEYARSAPAGDERAHRFYQCLRSFEDAQQREQHDEKQKEELFMRGALDCNCSEIDSSLFGGCAAGGVTPVDGGGASGGGSEFAKTAIRKGEVQTPTHR